MHTLHTRAAQIDQWWASEGDDQSSLIGESMQQQEKLSLWVRGWCPLLQGIARLCCDSRKQVRATAITYLQRSLLVHDLQSLTASEWESCFNTVLFPLLGKLLEPVAHHRPGDSQRQPQLTRAQLAADHAHWEETRIRAATLLSKVFLQHLVPLLNLPTFTALWLTLLDVMDKYMHVEHNDLLAEAVPEMMKNCLLVMETAGAFRCAPDIPPQTAQMREQLWNLTCDRIDVFLPGLSQEVTRSKTPVARLPSAASTNTTASTSASAAGGGPETETTTEGSDVQIDEIVVAVDVPATASPEPELTEQPSGLETGGEDSKPPLTASESSSALGFVPPTVFSLFNVPDPSDAAAFFFHNVDPAVSNDAGQGQQESQPSILPISLLPTTGQDLAPAVAVHLPLLVPAQAPNVEKIQKSIAIDCD